MQQSLNQVLQCFRKHKYGRANLLLSLLHSHNDVGKTSYAKPGSDSHRRWQAVKIEELQEDNTVVIYY
jgi:hypothetical protein